MAHQISPFLPCNRHSKYVEHRKGLACPINSGIGPIVSSTSGPIAVLTILQSRRHTSLDPICDTDWRSSCKMLTNTSSGTAAHQPTPNLDEFPPYSSQTIRTSSSDQIFVGGKRRVPHIMSKRSRACEVSKMITLEMLQPYFHKPLAEAAAHFGICVTLLKKICRKNGVSRWPHRQVRGLLRSIESIEKSLASCGKSSVLRASYRTHLTLQRAKLRSILHGIDSKSIQRQEEPKRNVIANSETGRDTSSHLYMDGTYGLNNRRTSSHWIGSNSTISVLQRPVIHNPQLHRSRLPPITALLHPENVTPSRSAYQNHSQHPMLSYY